MKVVDSKKTIQIFNMGVSVELSVEINGSVLRQNGANFNVVVNDIEEEIDEFAKYIGIQTIDKQEGPAPYGAQGELEWVKFFVNIIQEPAVVKAALLSLIYAVNEIANRKGKSKIDTAEGDKVIRIRILHKKLVLPAAVAIIKEYIEEILKDD